jgi:IS5 family transposase
MQLIVNQVTKEIICTAFDKGRKHDFNLLKQSKIAIKEETELLADKGYQGIKKYHKNSKTPYKKTKKSPLTTEQKKENSQLSSQRIIVENVIRCLKIFRILSSRYRNRRKRFGLRVNLISGIYNYELKLTA